MGRISGLYQGNFKETEDTVLAELLGRDLRAEHMAPWKCRVTLMQPGHLTHSP